MKINNIVDKHFIDTLNIDSEKDYKVSYCDGIDLLTISRMDLLPKIDFLLSVKNGINSSFYEKFYKSSLEAFSSGLYSEPGNEKKNSFEEYKDEFIRLAESIESEGFSIEKSVFLKGSNGAILDGGHRAAIAIVNNLKVPYINISDNFINYDLQYFKDRFVEEKFLNYTCLEYCKYKRKNIFVICLWPRLDKLQKEKASKLIREKLSIIYSNEVTFNYNGFKNFIIEVYKSQNWIGDASNNFSGVYGKADDCFRKKSSMKFFVVEENDSNKILSIKQAIRTMFEIGNHSVHSTDNYEESMDMLSILLNNNSIMFLNDADFSSCTLLFQNIEETKSYLKKKNINYEDILVCNDSVLKLYGIGDCERTEIICSHKYHFKDSIINNLFNEKNYNNDDLIYNPSNYFYFQGLKFLSINVIKEIKKQNGQYDEIKMIDKFIHKSNKESILLAFGRYKRKVIKIMKNYLKKTKVDTIYRKYYKKLRGKNEKNN